MLKCRDRDKNAARFTQLLQRDSAMFADFSGLTRSGCFFQPAISTGANPPSGVRKLVVCPW